MLARALATIRLHFLAETFLVEAAVQLRNCPMSLSVQLCFTYIPGIMFSLGRGDAHWVQSTMSQVF